jgi:uncharacterized protein YycO
MKSLNSIILILLVLTGCRENTPTSSNKEPTVEYASNSAASKEIQNFTNADWLYEEYFGEYGFPIEFKEAIIDDIKMVANGFALMFAQGQDVDSAISEFKAGMMILQVSGQFNEMLSQMKQDFNSSDYDFNQSKVALEPMTLEPKGELTSAEIERIKKVQEEAKEVDETYRREQDELVIKYNLPYALENRASKYVIYSQSMKSGGGKSSKSTPAPVVKKHQSNISSWHLEPGDILWTDGAGGIGHMAIFTTYNNCSIKNIWHEDLSIVEANTDGVKEKFALIEWQNLYDTVRSYYYSNGTNYDLATSSMSDDRRRTIVRFARAKIGQPYNWNFFNKKANDKTYCSQLVYSVYKDSWTQPIDLDSDGGFIVWPNDIINHKNIVMRNQTRKI